MNVKPFILNLTVFVCGALVMVYEIIGSRIVSPFIGASTYVWTSLIGVILGALSLGYWFGGRMADRDPHVRVLASAVFIAGGLVSLTILLKDVVLASIANAGFGLELKATLAAILLFAPASVALGFVTPYAVRLSMSSVDESGRTVGRLYALSTVGSIVGTFAAGFFLLPIVGSVRTLYIITAALIGLSVLLAPFAFTRLNFGILTLFVLSIAANEFSSNMLFRSSALHDIDTEYSRVQVFETTDPKNGRRFQAMATDPYFVQSAMYLDSDELVFRYNHFYHLLRYFRPDFQHTLMIGGAGYTFPREYLRTYPNATIDVAEIDPKMTEIARRFYRLKDDPRLKIFHEDGRTFLNKTAGGKYDVILMDAFGSLFSVPYQLTTVEAVRQFHRSLDENGIVIFNLGSAIRGEGSKFLQAEFKTYQEVFGNVLLFKVNLDYTDDHLQNLMIVACKTVCEDAGSSPDAEIAELLTHRYRSEFPLTLPVLTDDLAPVEYYNSFAQNLYRHR
ncbi:MAG: fused MFS/spermidine synthase [Acidobacteriota bacterium]